RILARLPFTACAGHPGGGPVCVVSRAAADSMVKEVEVWSVRVEGWSTAAAQAVIALAEVMAVPDRGFESAALLISVPASSRIDGVTDTLVKAGVSVRTAALVGSHATRYRVSAEGARPISTGGDYGGCKVRPAAYANASRRARNRSLCSGQKHGTRRRPCIQAVVE